jgi:integrase
VFCNALGYAVEQGHLASNPVDRIQWTALAVAASVDRRAVVSPAQARNLLAAVRALRGRGAHLEAFFACLYYAALRPSEAVMLRDSDLHPPAKGWGRIDLAASASRAGTAWTDHGTARQERGLKHRAAHETRTIPIPLGRRPYDLRHAAVSLWLNSGVPATEVARRAGHGAAVLLKIYAHCIGGQADAASNRITDALATTEPEPGPGEEGDDNEQAS